MADLEGHDTEEAKGRYRVASQILGMIRLDMLENPYYIIKCYRKCDSTNTLHEELVKVGGSTDDDSLDHDDIFFHYEHMDDLVNAFIHRNDTAENFVVVDFWSIDEGKGDC